MKTSEKNKLVVELDKLERRILFSGHILTLDQVIKLQIRIDEIYIKFGLQIGEADNLARTMH